MHLSGQNEVAAGGVNIRGVEVALDEPLMEPVAEIARQLVAAVALSAKATSRFAPNAGSASMTGRLVRLRSRTCA